jgi:hypothetical protein
MFRRKREGLNLKQELKERRKLEDVQPWFLVDDGEPDLEIQTNRSSNVNEDDFEH